MTGATGRTWHSGMMSSIRQDWATPRVLFDMLDREFHFTLDVCADEKNAKCPYFFDRGSLDRDWTPPRGGAAWCNPPYGRKIGDWISHAYREFQALRCKTVVLLLPARTDTQWFHDYCLKGEIRFLRGRLYFDDDPKARAPFPSMVVIFRSPQGVSR